MGLFSLFSFTKEIAIDLGTANTIIIHNDKIVIDEPSIVAIEVRSGKPIAVGKDAQQMQGKENDNIRTIRPLRQGVLSVTLRNMPEAAMYTCFTNLWLPLSALESM